MAEQSKPMRNRRVTFKVDGAKGQRIELDVRGDIVRAAGIRPDTFAAEVVYGEYDKVKAMIDTTGTVELWFGHAPGDLDEFNAPVNADVQLFKWRIVDAEGTELAVPVGAAGQPLAGGKPSYVKYRLILADVRERMQPPRGGFLMYGEINKEPFDDVRGLDANGNPLMSNKELVDACLEALGQGRNAPMTLTASKPLTNLSWMGNVAINELGRILDELGHTLIVRMDGTLRVVRIGDDAHIEFPSDPQRIVGTFEQPRVSRRGKVVVFTSFPTPVTDTRTTRGHTEESKFTGDWEFVVPDGEGGWVSIDDDPIVSKYGVQELIRENFDVVPPISRQDRRRLEPYLLHCIRLNSDRYGDQRPYRAVITHNGLLTDLSIAARIAIRMNNGLWINTPSVTGESLTPVTFYDHGRVIQVHQRIGKLMDDEAWMGPNAGFVMIDPGDLRIYITYEVHQYDPARVRRLPEFFYCAFQYVGGKVVKLGSGDALAALKGSEADRIVISRPDLRLWRADGVDQNATELEDLCEFQAPEFLVGSDNPAKEHLITGFYKAELSSRVNRIVYAVSDMTTRISEMTWWAPREIAVRNLEDKGYLAGSAYPSQPREQDRRMALGAPGSTQPAVLVKYDPSQGPEPSSRLHRVYLVMVEGEGGDRYTAPTFLYDVYLIQGGKAMAKKAAPEVPRSWGKCQAATHGLAYMDKEKLKLFHAFENPEVSDCEGETA